MTETKFSRISELLRTLAANKLRYLLLMLSGLLTGLTLVFTEIGFVEWITMVPAALVVLVRASDDKVRLRSLYLDGLAFFYPYYLVCYYWFLYLYPLEYVDGMTTGTALLVVLLAWCGLSLLQTLMGGCVFVLLGVVFKGKLCTCFSIIRVFSAAAMWAIFEWSQTIGWWGVPWGRLPIGQSEYPVGLQTASWFSSYFITFLIVAVNFLLAYALLEVVKWRLGVIVAASLLVFQYGAGALIWFGADLSEGEALKVACIQGNVSSSDKWSSESDLKTTEIYTRLVKQAAEDGAELILLPETAFPYDFDAKKYSYFNDMFCNMSKEYGVYILVGAYTSADEGKSLNSLICFDPNGERMDTVYAKRHLVPFGEYVPLRSLIEVLIPPLANLVLSTEDIAFGEGANIIDADGIGIGGLICFDSIYESLAYDSVREGAEIICISTNDSWFSDSAALYMHNAQAQLRAIENGRYIVRAANTGISTVINSRGEVMGRLEPLVEGNLYETVYARSDKTLCSVIGNSFVYLLLAGVAVLAVDRAVFKIKIKCASKK